MSDKTDKDYLMDLIERVAAGMVESTKPLAFEVRSAIKNYKENTDEES
jgi:hypothetical protein